MAEARMSNYQLSTAIANMLRRLTGNGLTRDKDTAEHLIRELHARLCPQPPAKGAHPSDKYAEPGETPAATTARHAGERAYGKPSWADREDSFGGRRIKSYES